MKTKSVYIVLMTLVCFAVGCGTSLSPLGGGEVLRVELSRSETGPLIHLAGRLVSRAELREQLAGLRSRYPSESENLTVGMTVSHGITMADLNDLLTLLSAEGFTRIALLVSDASDTTHYLLVDVTRVATSNAASLFTFSEGSWIPRPAPDDLKAGLRIVRSYSMTEDAQLYKKPRVPRGISRDGADAYVEGHRVGWFDVGSRTVFHLCGDGELRSAYAPMVVDVSQSTSTFRKGYENGCKQAAVDLRRYEVQIRGQIKEDQNRLLHRTQ